jgi:hypothetical protein
MLLMLTLSNHHADPIISVAGFRGVPFQALDPKSVSLSLTVPQTAVGRVHSLSTAEGVAD